MDALDHLFENNRTWAEKIKTEDPQFFSKLSSQQQPEYLWIGCSDSRVPSNQIIGLLPGEVFVHRNVANIVIHSDLNCQSVLQYAVDVLQVKHIMVVGHYGCGGVRAAMETVPHGLIDNWLRSLKDIYAAQRPLFTRIEKVEDRVNLLCELNVKAQVLNVCHTIVVQNAWERGQQLEVHGWIYGVGDGLLHDLNVT
ncbi:MAG TPA: carbonate dehydratase, partial [Spongiibacteraceae bacterium]|nr:carbonate dehydratase [Spongiibacteraceae bacterium]